MATPEKDTIYVDIDDEITTVIDKLRSSDGRIVALVLPKRATVFQSVVNMKLLKRAADSAKKRVVLVTTEANLMPLAGAVGLYVAATPQSKPEVPTVGDMPSDDEEVEESLSDAGDEEYTADNAGDRPVGELAKASGHVVGAAAAEETLTMDDEADAADEPKAVKLSHLKVPNFNRFRLRLVLGGLALILLVVGLYVCLAVLPKATIAITTNTSTVNASLAFTLDPSAQTYDATKQVMPAKIEQQQKTTTQQVDATGQKNNGTAATGTVAMTAGSCSGSVPNSVPAGTGVSTNGLTFITQDDTSFSPVVSHGKCTWTATSNTDITAQTGGSKYNVSGATFSVAGRSDVSASGSASGGTDDIIKVVAQTDIDNAKGKLANPDTTSIKAALEQALRTDGLYPLPATFNASAPTVTTSANVGDQADNVTVTQLVTYTMYGAKQADLDTAIRQEVSKHINTKDQGISDDGLGGATVTVGNTSAQTAQVTVQTQATVGPAINTADIKKQAAGKRVGDVKSQLNQVPGVTGVDVQLSPFWVSAVPSDTQKITVTISKAH